MLYNFEFSFTGTNGRQIFVPTTASRIFGEKLRKEILRLWSPPEYFYHFKDGGHVAATKAHLDSGLFLRLDLKAFYDTITRSKVHRALRSTGFSQKESWLVACHSTVSKRAEKRPYSLPFGFIQSPVLATLVLHRSALGKAISGLVDGGMRLSIYMDDILLSCDDDAPLIAAKVVLKAAADIAGFRFNALKTFGPAPAVEVFNIDLSRGSLSITPSRMAEFEVAIANGTPETILGILGYVGTVNGAQRLALSAL